MSSPDPRSADEAAQADPDDLADLTADDYVTAAETLASEAINVQHDTLDTGVDDRPDQVSPHEAPTDRDGRYRLQLREAQAVNDRLAATIESLQRAEVDRLAALRLADPTDLWRGDESPDMADLVADDGRVDAKRVNDAITKTLDAHEHWARPSGMFKGPLFSGSTSVEFDRPTRGFVDAFRRPDGAA